MVLQLATEECILRTDHGMITSVYNGTATSCFTDTEYKRSIRAV